MVLPLTECDISRRGVHRRAHRMRATEWLALVVSGPVLPGSVRCWIWNDIQIRPQTGRQIRRHKCPAFSLTFCQVEESVKGHNETHIAKWLAEDIPLCLFLLADGKGGAPATDRSIGVCKWVKRRHQLHCAEDLPTRILLADSDVPACCLRCPILPRSTDCLQTRASPHSWTSF